MKYSMVNRNTFDTAPLRFISKVDVTKGCWIWKGCTDIGGYGQLRLGRKSLIQAHRLSAILHKGQFPKENEVIMHLCDNPPCVNPNHLKVGSQSENIQHARDIKLYPRKKKCFRGHEYSRIDSNGWNHCKICHNINATKWRNKNVTRVDGHKRPV